MMGAILNIGAVVGEGTMIDMGVVLGGRATVGKHCHIGAGTVLAGVIEPASATPVIIEDDVFIGANAVVIEGVRVGQGAVVGRRFGGHRRRPGNAVVARRPCQGHQNEGRHHQRQNRASRRPAHPLSHGEASQSPPGGLTPERHPGICPACR